MSTNAERVLAPEWSGEGDLADPVFRTVVGHSPFAVIVGAPEGRIIYANPAACDLFGGSEDDLRRVGRPGVTDPDLPVWRFLLEERRRTGETSGIAPMNRLDGTTFLGEVASSIVELPDGDERTCVIIHDVTEKVRMQRNLAALNDVARALLFRADSAHVLALVSRHARIIFDASDAAVVVPAQPPDDVVVAAADGTRMSKLLGRTYPHGTLSRRVIDSCQAVLIESMATVVHSQEARELGLGPAMVAPISTGEETVGALFVGVEAGRAPYDSDSLRIFASFAERAGLAVAFGESRAEAERLQVQRAEQLQRALDSRIIIEQAKGVVSGSKSIGVDEAFNRLRAYARSHNQNIHDVAQAIVRRDLLL